MAHDESAQPLAAIAPGTTVELLSAAATGSQALRLAELGLTPSAHIRVMRSCPGQPVLVAVRGSRLAIDRQLANHILVCPCPEAADGACRHRRRRRHADRRGRRR
jgi:Fe2+ transport system protein FeoA